MKTKEIQERKKSIKQKVDDWDTEEALTDLITLLNDLSEAKLYSEICKIYDANNLGFGKETPLFNIAYALAAEGRIDDAEIVYEGYLDTYPNATSALNNLSLIKNKKGDHFEAFALISKAYELDPSDGIISDNFESTRRLTENLKETDSKFKSALNYLPKENSFVRSKLRYFIESLKNDKEFVKGRLPIPNWKWKVLIGTDEHKADSLRKQWLDKFYIKKTDAKGDFGVAIYEINPYLEEAVETIDEVTHINAGWIKSIENISVDRLNESGYYSKLRKIKKVNKKYRSTIHRDFDELYLNYLFGNHKSVVILSGSFLELLMIYHLEEKGIAKFEITNNEKPVSKDIYKATLDDFLKYFEQNKLLSNPNFHLGNISRLFRNYIHPGREIKSQDILDGNKAQLCFLSVMEIFNELL